MKMPEKLEKRRSKLYNALYPQDSMYGLHGRESFSEGFNAAIKELEPLQKEWRLA